MDNMQKCDDLACAILRGECPPWPGSREDDFSAAFLLRSEYHGIQSLLDRQLHSARSVKPGWPQAVTDALRRAAAIQAIWEVRHQSILDKALVQLWDIGICPILFKGSALAYEYYPSPALRRRGDTDLIIQSDARMKVDAVLNSIGFECEADRGDLNSYQATYSLADPASFSHNLDVHWKISNSQVLSNLFSYEELASESRSLPALSSCAKAVGTIDALLLACMHRASHEQCPYSVNGIEYYGGDRLIWLYDIHLLVGALQSRDYNVFLERAERKGLGGVCLDGIERAHDRFNTSVPERLRDKLFRSRHSGRASRYLSSSVIHQYYLNLQAVEGPQNRLRFLVQLLFPSPKYMQRRYSHVKPDWLPWLYLRRAAIEAFKRVHRTLAAWRLGPSSK